MQNNNLLKINSIALLVISALIVHLLLIWPGSLSPDSAGQYQMAIQGVYSDHHPPLMSFVWRYLNYIVSGPGMMLVLQLSFLYGAIFYLINSVKNLRYINLLLILLPVTPQVMEYSNNIWKDTHFAFSFLFIASYLAYLTVNNIKLKFHQFIGLLIVLLYGTAVKFQAQYCAPILLGWMIYASSLDYRLFYKNSYKKFFGIFISLLVFFYLLLNTVNYGLVPNVQKDHSWQFVKLYDLAAISMAINQDLFPEFSKNSNFTMQELFHKFDYCKSMATCEYSKYHVDELVFPADAILKKSAKSSDMRELYFTWAKEVVKHPVAYFKHRLTNMIGILCSMPVVFKSFHKYFEYNSLSYLIFDIIVRLIISNFIYVMLSVLYLIFGLYVLCKTKDNINRFAIPLVMFNAISVIMLVVLFFCSMASTPRYTYISMCMVHSSHLFAYLCFKNFNKNLKNPVS